MRGCFGRGHVWSVSKPESVTEPDVESQCGHARLSVGFQQERNAEKQAKRLLVSREAMTAIRVFDPWIPS